jgi:Holliday junction resolvase
MSTKYERGRDAEYRTINELRANGYDAVRTAGSHGAADVIAWNGVHIRFIQCKTWLTRVGDYKADIQKLMEMRLPPGSQCELWARQVGQRGWAVQTVVRVEPMTLEARATPDHETTMLPLFNEYGALDY